MSDSKQKSMMTEQREKIYHRALDMDFQLWTKNEAPQIFEQMKEKLPSQYQDESRVGTIYAHAETGFGALEIYTLDQGGYRSCKALVADLAVDVFDLEGTSIFSGSFSEFEPQLEAGNLKLFFGIRTQ